MKYYREKFEPSDHLAAPRANAGVFVICADTQEEADYLAASRDLWRLKLNYGQHLPYPHPDEALDYVYNPQERRVVEANKANRFAGTPEKLRHELAAFADEHGFEELLVLTITYDFEKRLRSYELLADAFELARHDAAAE